MKKCYFIGMSEIFDAEIIDTLKEKCEKIIEVHSAALNGSWCGGKQQLSAANGRGISKDFPRQW